MVSFQGEYAFNRQQNDCRIFRAGRRDAACKARSYGGKLKLFYLPPYSPELNPDEQVWRDLKANAMGRSEILSREDLERKVTAHLEALKGLPKKVRSFFQLPMTRYAAL